MLMLSVACVIDGLILPSPAGRQLPHPRRQLDIGAAGHCSAPISITNLNCSRCSKTNYLTNVSQYLPKRPFRLSSHHNMRNYYYNPRLCQTAIFCWFMVYRYKLLRNVYEFKTTSIWLFTCLSIIITLTGYDPHTSAISRHQTSESAK